MAIEPVVDPAEAAVLAVCPQCNGSGLMYIERFLTEADRKMLEKLREKGFRVLAKPLNQVVDTDDCRCKEIKRQPKPKASGRPLLTLKKTACP